MKIHHYLFHSSILLLANGASAQTSTTAAAAAATLSNYQECSNPTSRSFQYCNESLSHENRVEALIQELHLVEKIWSLAPDPSLGVDCNVVTRPIPRLGLGRYMWLTETNSQANSICSGTNKTRCATAFPGQLGLAASFNRSVWSTKGEVISTELRALYNSGGKRRCEGCLVGLTGFGPNINIARDPRFGRTSELPGEDPYLNGEYAVEYVQGMQPIDSQGHVKMLAFLKHYTAYSREKNRGSDTYNISKFDYFDTYLPAYEAGMTKGGASGVMCSYNGENGRPSCANDFILNTVMRQTWKRPDAMVMTDCGVVKFMLHEPAHAPSPEHAAAWTISNGTDIEAGTHIWADSMVSAVQQGLVKEETIDAAVRRVYRAMMKAGRFDNPNHVSWSKIGIDAIGSQDHQKIRNDAARQSAVLLRNLGNALPLKAAGQTVVVVGPQAANGHGYLPDYFGDEVCPHGSFPFKCIPTTFEAIQQYNVNGQTLLYPGLVDELSLNQTEDYEHALAAVRDLADVVVLSMGISIQSEREGIDRTATGLPGLQDQFALDVLAIAAKRDIPAILLLTNGGALSIDDLLPSRDYSQVYNADKKASSAVSNHPITTTSLPSCYQSGRKGKDHSSSGVVDEDSNNIVFPGKYAIVEAYNPSLGMKSIVAALYGDGPISWGRLVTTMYPKSWAETHPVDQYDISAGDGLTYRYYNGDTLATFGEGMPSENPSQVKLECSLEKDPTAKNKWSIHCDATNLAEDREYSALVMVYVRASEAVRNNVPYPVPLRSLKAFERVMVGPGVTTSMKVDISIEDLMLVNNDGHKEARSGRHFDIVDVWDGWNAFASYNVSLDNVDEGMVLRSY